MDFNNLRTAVVMLAAYAECDDGENEYIFVSVVKYMLRKHWGLPITTKVSDNMIVDFVIANFD